MNDIRNYNISYLSILSYQSVYFIGYMTIEANNVHDITCMLVHRDLHTLHTSILYIVYVKMYICIYIYTMP